MASNASNEQNLSEHKQKFIDKYNELLASFSAEHFKQYSKIASKPDPLESYKQHLLEMILLYFNAIWDATDTDSSLRVLDALKNDPKNGPEKKWRPTGKSVDEQIRPLVFNQLRWQIKYYEKQIQFQKQQLERAVTQVEGRRQKWNDFLQRVESTKVAVTGELKEFKKIEAQITDIEEKIIFDLQLI